jgi:hypothetical protein
MPKEILCRACALIALAPLFAGCSPRPSRTELPDAERHILRFSSLYGEFQGTHGRPPKSMDELKTWLKSQPKARLTRYNAEDVDQAVVSPRDKEPYVLIDPKLVQQAPGGMARVIAHEKTGVGGKKMTVSRMGGAQEMTDEEIQQATAPRRMGP